MRPLHISGLKVKPAGDADTHLIFVLIGPQLLVLLHHDQAGGDDGARGGGWEGGLLLVLHILLVCETLKQPISTSSLFIDLRSDSPIKPVQISWLCSVFFQHGRAETEN